MDRTRISDPTKQHASSHLRISSSSSYQNKVIRISVYICEVFNVSFKIRNYSVNIIVGGSNSYTSDPGKQHASYHLRISSSSSYQNKVIWLSVDICEVFTFYFKIRNYSLWIELILVIRQTNAYLDHSFSSHRWVVRGVPEVKSLFPVQANPAFTHPRGGSRGSFCTALGVGA